MTSCSGLVAERLDAALATMPVIAILRGLTSDVAVETVTALFDAGIRVAEVPLNSPDPFTTIAQLRDHFGDKMVIGASTVTTTAQVARLRDCGCDIIVSPVTDASVIAAALAAGMVPVPGYATPTEAFAAIAAGARHLKFFPAAGRAAEIAALRAVLPPGISIIAVGGVGAETLSDFRKAGCSAFGIGSDIFHPGVGAKAVAQRATSIATAIRASILPVPRLLCNPEAGIGESPVWCAHDNRVTWVDPVGQRLLHHAIGTQGHAETALTQSIFGIAATPEGRLVGTIADGFCAVDRDSGFLSPGSRAEVGAGCRMNDLTVDSGGGLWGGSMHRGLLAGKGAIFHAAGLDTPCRRVAAGLGVANGMAFGPDGRLYVVDTLARTLLAYPADIVTGSLGEPVIITDFADIPGKPDGMTGLADGSFWVAMWGGGRIVRIGVDGALIEQIELPCPNVSSLCLAGSGTLLVTTSRMRLGRDQLETASGSGGLYAVGNMGN